MQCDTEDGVRFDICSTRLFYTLTLVHADTTYEHTLFVSQVSICVLGLNNTSQRDNLGMPRSQYSICLDTRVPLRFEGGRVLTGITAHRVSPPGTSAENRAINSRHRRFCRPYLQLTLSLD